MALHYSLAADLHPLLFPPHCMLSRRCVPRFAPCAEIKNRKQWSVDRLVSLELWSSDSREICLHSHLHRRWGLKIELRSNSLKYSKLRSSHVSTDHFCTFYRAFESKLEKISSLFYTLFTCILLNAELFVLSCWLLSPCLPLYLVASYDKLILLMFKQAANRMFLNTHTHSLSIR